MIQLCVIKKDIILRIHKQAFYTLQYYTNNRSLWILQFYDFGECNDFEDFVLWQNQNGSGDISPPSEFIYRFDIWILRLRPPAEVKFFPSLYVGNLKKFIDVNFGIG